MVCVVYVWCVWYESFRARRVCPGACLYAANWEAEHLGASSRRPRHPDGGGTPGRVPVYTAQKRQARLKLPCAPVETVKQHQKRAGTCRCTTKCEHTLSRNCNCGVSRNKHSSTVRICLCSNRSRCRLTYNIHCRTKENSEQVTVRYKGPQRETNNDTAPSICIPPWAGGVAPHSGGRRGSSYVLARVPLCQYQTSSPEPFSPTQTTRMPGGGFHFVSRVRLFQK